MRKFSYWINKNRIVIVYISSLTLHEYSSYHVDISIFRPFSANDDDTRYERPLRGRRCECLGIFLALGTRICLFKPLFDDSPDAGTAQSLLRHLYALMCVCDVYVFYEYASINRYNEIVS